MPEMEPVYVWCQSSCQIPPKLISTSGWDTENGNGLNTWWWAWSALIMLLSLLSMAFAFCWSFLHSGCPWLLCAILTQVPIKFNCQTPFLLSPSITHSLLKCEQAPDFDTALLQGTSLWLDPPNSVSFPPLSLLGAILKTIDDQMCPGKQLGWAQG